ncbi:ent-kaurene oxidase [Aspergillus pseudocaelatus]|uniref:Ent-kaurene oxidase n=1 Tax=Aspergillus pseudocaelatus TaxID=1825620 RepID=A0ABQ6X355_9EURO|nr:ent-kaurene oxidase [Aspergillus pseudocaelatus]
MIEYVGKKKSGDILMGLLQLPRQQFRNLGSPKTWEFVTLAVTAVVTCLLFYLAIASRQDLDDLKAPVIGYNNPWEPNMFVRLRFIRRSRSILREGYHQYKHYMFKVRRVGTDILVVSSQYMGELQHLTKDATGSVPPLVKDYPGEWVHGTPFLRSTLQNLVLQQNLTPNLPAMIPTMVKEMNAAVESELGAQKDWTKVDIQPIIARIITRITGQIFLGEVEGSNEEWLDATIHYTENMFLTGWVLRFFPRFMCPLVVILLPSYYRLLRNVHSARRVIGRIVSERRAMEAQGTPEYRKPADVLQWMMNAATGEQAEPNDLAQRMLLLSVTSIHTTTLTMTQTIYDLCAHPEYFEPVRNEVVEALRRHRGWNKSTLTDMSKTDSLLKETQRFSPIFLLTWNRITDRPVTLSNGLYLPAGTRVAVPSNEILQDPAKVPGIDPSVYDAFRYSRIREDQGHPGNAQKYLMAKTDLDNLAFGYGKFACPGRFYAVNEMKMIFARMLLCYEFKYPGGQGRPQNFTIDSDLYPDPLTRLLIRKRDSIEDGIEELLETC